MNAQTQRVDVLAVMRAVAEFGVSAPEWHDMTKAAAAVAELINTANAMLDRIAFECDEDRYGYQYSALSAALTALAGGASHG